MTIGTIPASRPSNVLAAMLWMAVALGSFTMVAVTGRIAGAGIDTMHVMLYRSAIALLVLVVIVGFTPAGFRQLSIRRMGLHLVRNVIHFVAQYSWLSALLLIPLAQLFALEFTAPLWVALLAPLILSERTSVLRVIAALTGFCGILVIVQPGTLPINQGTVFALVAALGFAGSMILTKLLVRSDTVWAFLFHMSWMQLLIAAAMIGQKITWPDMETSIGIGGVALFGLLAHFALARAFVNADALIVAPMDFLRLPLIMLVGVMLYDETIQPTVLLGAGVVVFANALNLIAERLARR